MHTALSVALCGLLLAGPAHAAPPAEAPAAKTGDAVLQLLHERGLVVKAEAEHIARQVRDTASDLVVSAMNFLGVPYRRGGDSAEEGFDCSGFTRHIFEVSLGLVLPRRADEQARASGLLAIDRDQLKPGDLVFFNTMRRAFSHVGIYVGEGRFIHSPRTGAQVRIEDMRTAYWTARFNGARRADAQGAAVRSATSGPMPALSPALSPAFAPALSSGPATAPGPLPVRWQVPASAGAKPAPAAPTDPAALLP